MIMKSLIKILIAFAFLLAYSTVSAQDYDNVEKANKKVDKAQQKAENAEEKAEDVYEREWKEFKKSTENKIDNNEKRIKELRKHKTSDPAKQEAYNKKIDKLEAQNKRLEEDLDNYDYNGKDDWQNFKNKVNKNVDQLGDAIDNATE